MHGSMYYKLFTNESKEYMEYADYTFEEHFKGKLSAAKGVAQIPLQYCHRGLPTDLILNVSEHKIKHLAIAIKRV